MKKLIVTALLILSGGGGYAASSGAEPAAGAVWKEPKTGMEFVYVPAGCFEMGRNSHDENAMPSHQVCLKGFYLGKYEVTQAQWRKITGESPSRFSGDNNPVESVSWKEIQKGLEFFNGELRLPSEAEWEYACTAGGAHRRICGDVGTVDNGEQLRKAVNKLAWYDKTSDGKTHPVGQKQPNAWGLYDMSGNVYEWTEDRWHENYVGAPTDGSARLEDGPLRGHRVARGGAWDQPAEGVFAQYRFGGIRSKKDETFGFRLVRPIP